MDAQNRPIPSKIRKTFQSQYLPKTTQTLYISQPRYQDLLSSLDAFAVTSQSLSFAMEHVNAMQQPARAVILHSKHPSPIVSEAFMRELKDFLYQLKSTVRGLDQTIQLFQQLKKTLCATIRRG